MWGDPDKFRDERREKKIYKIGKSAAYSIGGGIALKILHWFIPSPTTPRPKPSLRCSAAPSAGFSLYMV